MSYWVTNSHSVRRDNEVLRDVSIWSAQDRSANPNAYYYIEVGIGTEDGKFDTLGTYDGSEDVLFANASRSLYANTGVARRLRLGDTLLIQVTKTGGPSISAAGLTVEWTLGLVGGQSGLERPLFGTSGYIPDARVREAVGGLTNRLNGGGVTERLVSTALQDPLTELLVDGATGCLFSQDSLGKYHGRVVTASTAAQALGTADEYVTSSGIRIPSFGMQGGMTFVWQISASKTAASTATPAYILRLGREQTTTDTARLTLTGPAQTAAADTGILTIMATVQLVGTSGVIQGTASWSHNAAATGFANNDAGAVEGTSAAFDNTGAGEAFLGLSITTGASAAWTLTQVHGEMRC